MKCMNVDDHSRIPTYNRGGGVVVVSFPPHRRFPLRQEATQDLALLAVG